jgi:UDP-N-acetylmuramyl tripeptide synthase
MATTTDLPLRTRTATVLGHATASLSRRLGRGNGSVIGGRVLLAVDPHALARLASGHRSILVSGTNGKTTTTRLLAAAIGVAGPVVTNVRGANMPPGLAAAFGDGTPGAAGVLEVDEAWLPKVADDVQPAVIVLLNLSRDQLDRNNEVRTLSATWRRAVQAHPGAHVVANADDPLTAWAAMPAQSVTWVAAGQPWTADATGCPSCAGRILFATDGPGWRCEECGLSRPAPDVEVSPERISLRGRDLTLDLRLPGRANRSNAAMAVSASAAFGVDPGEALAALSSLEAVDGRYRSTVIDGVPVRLLLAKNPAGWLEVLDIISDSSGPMVIGINARIADGKDPSWLWDVPFERLRGRFVVASGERSHDMAVRLHYAEVEHSREPDLHLALRQAGLKLGRSDPRVDLVANYTSFMSFTAGLHDD